MAAQNAYGEVQRLEKEIEMKIYVGNLSHGLFMRATFENGQVIASGRDRLFFEGRVEEQCEAFLFDGAGLG